jgi:hypothetical protein
MKCTAMAAAKVDLHHHQDHEDHRYVSRAQDPVNGRDSFIVAIAETVASMGISEKQCAPGKLH